MKEINFPPVNIQNLAERLKALAEPKRLLIFNLLMEGVQCNCELGDALDIAPNLISHHLSKLRPENKCPGLRPSHRARDWFRGRLASDWSINHTKRR